MATLTAELPREDPKARVNATLGMIFFIGSWSMTFGTLYLSFLILRDQIGTWPPEGIVLPNFALATTGTLVLLASSAAIHAAVRRGRTGAPGFAGLWLFGLVLGLMFSVAQTWLWYDLLAAGGGPQSGDAVSHGRAGGAAELSSWCSLRGARAQPGWRRRRAAATRGGGGSSDADGGSE